MSNGSMSPRAHALSNVGRWDHSLSRAKIVRVPSERVPTRTSPVRMCTVNIAVSSESLSVGRREPSAIAVARSAMTGVSAAKIVRRGSRHAAARQRMRFLALHRTRTTGAVDEDFLGGEVASLGAAQVGAGIAELRRVAKAAGGDGLKPGLPRAAPPMRSRGLRRSAVQLSDANLLVVSGHKLLRYVLRPADPNDARRRCQVVRIEIAPRPGAKQGR